MPSTFPTTDDVFDEPSSPASTPLDSAGSGTRIHSEHHRDLGDAIEAIQANAALLTHDHSASGPRATSKLAGANTHESPDTDAATSSLHHTLGTGATQAAAGNHTHTQAQSHSSPDTDSATTALHHTLGTGANQAAAGNHTHTQVQSHGSPDTDTATSALHHTLGTGANQAAAGNHSHSALDKLLSFTASQSNSSSIGTTETAIMTAASSITLTAGKAYRVDMVAGHFTSGFTNLTGWWRIRKNNASGTIILALFVGKDGGSYTFPTVPTRHFAVYIRNNTGADISFTPCWTIQSEMEGGGGTVNTTLVGTSTNPRSMRFSLAGDASNYANAISVT